MIAKGIVHRYQDNVDTDVIIPARYLNTQDAKELASHCMEAIDAEFAKDKTQHYFGPNRKSVLRSS